MLEFSGAESHRRVARKRMSRLKNMKVLQRHGLMRPGVGLRSALAFEVFENRQVVGTGVAVRGPVLGVAVVADSVSAHLKFQSSIKVHKNKFFLNQNQVVQKQGLPSRLGQSQKRRC